MRTDLNNLDAINIDEITDWYETQYQAISFLYVYVKNNIYDNLGDKTFIDQKFFSMNEDEILEYFDFLRNELNTMVSFNIIASIEAMVRMDFMNRAISRKMKDSLSKDLRKISKSKGARISLIEDIINTTLVHNRKIKIEIDRFKELYKFRHWLAHGRYWEMAVNNSFTINEVFSITQDFLNSYPFLNK